MNPHIFREYDIRGVADRDLTDDLARDLGRALGTFQKRAGRRRIALGQDCRLSSPRLHRELLGGLLEAGMQVTDIGIGATPMMYFAVFHLDLEGGVQITGSHNPPGDNGFKMMKGKASLYGPDILELRSMIERRDFDLTLDGTVTSLDLMSAYAGFIRGNVNVARKDIRFAIDAGNGAGGPQALAAMQAAGLSPVALLCDMDGNFPVHHPDPSDPHTLELLRDTVLSQGLELGIAFDGDADRIGVIDARGDIIWGDKLLIVLSRALLLDHPGAAVLGEVKCSQTLYDDIAQHGGRPILWKTGHSLIKAKMKEEGALLAGEMSGHVFFADRFFGFDDAVYAALAPARDRGGQRPPTARAAGRCAGHVLHPRAARGLPGRREVRGGHQGARALPRHQPGGGGGRRPHPVRRRLGPGARVQHAARARDALRGAVGGAAHRDPPRGGGRGHGDPRRRLIHGHRWHVVPC
jgi:phosphomannomutase/phosphoglucomutase